MKYLEISFVTIPEEHERPRIMKKVSDHDFLNLVNSQRTMGEIARELGCSRQTIYAKLAGLGVEGRLQKKHRMPVLSPERDQAMQRLAKFCTD